MPHVRLTISDREPMEPGASVSVVVPEAIVLIGTPSGVTPRSSGAPPARSRMLGRSAPERGYCFAL